MKRLIRLTCAWMVVLFAVGVFAGCSSSGSFSAGTNKKSDSDPAATANPDGTTATGNVGTGNDALDTGKATPIIPAGSSDSPTPKPAGECVVGDKVNFEFPADVQSCMDSGKVYNWVTKACTNVGNAQSYTCDFDSLYSAAKATLAKGESAVDPTSILDAKNKGALLISCGEKNNSDIIIAQWYYPAASTRIDDCNFSHNNPMVISACYRFYPDHNEPAPTTDPAVKQQRVQDCLNL